VRRQEDGVVAGGVELAVGAVDDVSLGQDDAAFGLEVVDDELMLDGLFGLGLQREPNNQQRQYRQQITSGAHGDHAGREIQGKPPDELCFVSLSHPLSARFFRKYAFSPANIELRSFCVHPFSGCWRRSAWGFAFRCAMWVRLDWTDALPLFPSSDVCRHDTVRPTTREWMDAETA
jgi:hypothetical protein